MEIDTKYKVLIGLLVIALFAGGIFIGMKVGNIEKEVASQVKNEEKYVDIYGEEEKSIETISKTYDIELVYEDYYMNCQEKITKKEMIYNTTLEELKEKEEEKQEKEGKIYQISKEDNTMLVYSRNIPENCPNHFKAVLENKIINIYQVVDDDTQTLYRKIDTTDKLVREDMKEELEKGIILNSYEELNLLIEDLES